MYLDHFQIFIIYGENMEGYEEDHCCIIFRYWPYMEKKVGKIKLKQINQLLHHFQILAICGENLEGNCNIFIFGTSLQA